MREAQRPPGRQQPRERQLVRRRLAGRRRPAGERDDVTHLRLTVEHCQRARDVHARGRQARQPPPHVGHHGRRPQRAHLAAGMRRRPRAVGGQRPHELDQQERIAARRLDARPRESRGPPARRTSPRRARRPPPRSTAAGPPPPRRGRRSTRPAGRHAPTARPTSGPRPRRCAGAPPGARDTPATSATPRPPSAHRPPTAAPAASGQPRDHPKQGVQRGGHRIASRERHGVGGRHAEHRLRRPCCAVEQARDARRTGTRPARTAGAPRPSRRRAPAPRRAPRAPAPRGWPQARRPARAATSCPARPRPSSTTSRPRPAAAEPSAAASAARSPARSRSRSPIIAGPYRSVRPRLRTHRCRRVRRRI